MKANKIRKKNFKKKKEIEKKLAMLKIWKGSLGKN